MAKARSAERARRRGGPTSGLPGVTAHEVGARLRARLVALGVHIGLFPKPAAFSAESRFRRVAMLPAEEPLPAGMAALFAEELASRARLGAAVERCHCSAEGPYRVYCLPYCHYEGFQALLYVEREGTFVAGWKEEEMELERSPRSIWAGEAFEPVEVFLDHVLGATL